MSEKKTNQKFEYWVGHTIKPVETKQTYQKIPLHMTILPWTLMSENCREEFFEKIAGICDNTPKFKIVGKEKDMFGPKYDVKVCRVESEETLELHKQFLEIAQDLGGGTSSIYVRDDFSPHISDQAVEVFLPGQTKSVNSIEIFSRKSPEKYRFVEVVFEIGVHDEA